jgi:hypothetical protein
MDYGTDKRRRMLQTALVFSALALGLPAFGDEINSVCCDAFN